MSYTRRIFPFILSGGMALTAFDALAETAAYTAGDTVTATRFRLVNLDTSAVAVEWKVWLEVPTIPPLSFNNVGADGSVVLPPGLDNELRPVSLFPATAVPVGTFQFGCRLHDPVTGELLSEDLNPFTVQ